MANFQKMAAQFAAKHVREQAPVQIEQKFPQNIWQKMAEAGLFKIGLPESYGGSGGTGLDILQAGEAFVRQGRNLGLGISLIFQQIIARYILGKFGQPRQCQQYLSAAADGKCIFSFAVSEPQRGASPKTMATAASRHNSAYLLSGEKIYLTNGPIADVFIVIAVTADSLPKKEFTAFIVPRQTPGLTVSSPMSLDFLKSSPHGRITLQRCLLEPDAVLGEVGKAWREMVVKLGEVEDVIMMGPVLGSLAAQLDLLTSLLVKKNAPAERELFREFGALDAHWQAMQTLAYEAAARLDKDAGSPYPLVIALAHLAANFSESLVKFPERWKITAPDLFFELQTDLASLGFLQKRRRQIHEEKAGRALLINT